jgi:hypothetical protein
VACLLLAAAAFTHHLSPHYPPAAVAANAKAGVGAHARRAGHPRWHPSLAAEARTIVCAVRFILDWSDPVTGTNAVSAGAAAPA